MKKRFAVLLIGGILLLGIVLCAVFEQKSNDNAPEVDSIDPANCQLNEFDEALIEYLRLNGYDSSDFLISPTALRASLCLAASGAQSTTRAELVKAAGFSVIDACDLWYSRLTNSAAFHVANSVWSNTDLSGAFTDSYTDGVKEKYDADACAYESDGLTQAMNEWIDQQTDGMISTVAEDADGAATVLVNALHLQAAWKNAFSETDGFTGVFVDRNGNEKKMDFIEQTGEYWYAEESGTKVLVIPMEDNLSFVCFFGNRTDMFQKMTRLQKEQVYVVLPKFELVSAFDSTDLVGFLLSRGIDEAIDERAANFYNMCQGTDWFIQEILQKNKISIGEAGINSTGNKAKAASIDTDADIKEFVVDSPFSFAVFSDFGTSGQHMLLYGQLMNND